MIIDELLGDMKMSRYKLSKLSVFHRQQYLISAEERLLWRDVRQEQYIR